MARDKGQIYEASDKFKDALQIRLVKIKLCDWLLISYSFFVFRPKSPWSSFETL